MSSLAYAFMPQTAVGPEVARAWSWHLCAFVRIKSIFSCRVCGLSALKLVQGFEEGIFVGAEWWRVVVYRLRIALEIRGVAASSNRRQKGRFNLQRSFKRSTGR